MAFNINDKRSLFDSIIPSVNFSITSNSITVASERISTPRVIPFDIPGKCRHCKSTEGDMDYMVTKEGVTVWCSRINGPAFVPFDFVYDLPGHTFFKIKNKGRAFDVEHVNVQHAPTVCAPVAIQLTVPPEPKSVEQQSMLVDNSPSPQNITLAPAHPVQEADHRQQQQQQLQDFGNTLLDVSTFLPAEQQQQQVTGTTFTAQQLNELVNTMSAAATLLPSQQPQQHIEQQPQQQVEMQGFVDAMSAATTFLPSQTQTASPQTAEPKVTKKKKLEKRKPSVEAEKEEEAAVKTIEQPQNINLRTSL
uniref:Uncharacterized protein n=1 Tax=Globodera rostochiensis TaxID=31243 RepID=A0A914IFX5_GLORO